MNTLNRAIFLLVMLLHASSAFSLLYKYSIIELTDGRTVIFLGDNHNLGPTEVNKLQAMDFLNFVKKLAERYPDNPIVLLTESFSYEPEGLSEQMFEDYCLNAEIMDDFNSISDLLAQPIYSKNISNIGGPFEVEYFKAKMSKTTWNAVLNHYLLPPLKQLIKKTNIQIIPCDPRLKSHDSEVNASTTASVGDLLAYPRRLVELYKYPYDKIDIKDENQKNYFMNNIIPYSLERIASLSGKISDSLSIPINDLYTKPYYELTGVEKKAVFEIIRDHVDTCKNDMKSHRETIFDAQLLYKILSQEHSEKGTIFVVPVGGAHVDRLKKALWDMGLDLNKEDENNIYGHSKDFSKEINKIPLSESTYYHSFAYHLIAECAEYADLFLRGDKSPVFDEIKNIFPEGGIFDQSYVNSSLASVIEMIKSADNEARDANDYSLFGYFVDFKDTFFALGTSEMSSEQALELFDALLDKEGIDPNIVDPDAMTPLIRSLYYLDLKLRFLQTNPEQGEVGVIIDYYGKILRKLVDKGADTQFPVVDFLLERIIALITSLNKEYPEIMIEIGQRNDETCFALGK